MGRGFYTFSYYTLGSTIRGLWRVHADGVENVPMEGGAILASNHLSYADHYLMPCNVKRQVFFVSKAQHFDVPVQRWLFRQWGVIPLKRGDGDSEAYTTSLKVLTDGDLLCIYPEGTRSTDHRLYKGHTGVARLALEARVPIIPVGMMNSDEILPKGVSRPKMKKAFVKFGKPLAFPEFYGMQDDRKVTRDVTDRVMLAIRDLTGQEYVDAYAKVADYEKAKAAAPADDGTTKTTKTTKKPADDAEE
ncbi:MAG: lysophospholipid acyltransferase family protein [Thermoplasmatota archaeon]